MLNMLSLFSLLFLSLLCLTVTGQESIGLLNMCETSNDILQASSQSDLPIAVMVSARNLNEVSRSILKAETWLRPNVLAHYPASKITTIVVGTSAFCQQNQNQNLNVVLSSLKNLHHSLTRWGLQKEIKVSASFHLDCLLLNSASHDTDFKMAKIKPLIEFLQSINSTYALIPHLGFSHFDDESLNFVSTQMKKLGFFHLENINVVANAPKFGKSKTIIRKLSALDSSLIGPFPVKPTPIPEIAEPPLGFSIGNPSPSEPLPPLAQIVSSPPPIPSPTSFSFNFAPEEPPFLAPTSSFSPQGSTLPPCNPINNGSPSPQIAPIQKLWCVAKPSVLEEKLQEALDYACGEGGADCEEIRSPQGKCYYPNTVFAHASYAFNSYWQKHKRIGGTCSFGGTAMLVNSDPSFLHCRFILS